MNISNFILLFLLSSPLFAMDNFNEPFFSDDASRMIREQLKIKELCLKDSLRNGAQRGFTMPWIGSFLLGIYLGDTIGDRGGKSEIFENTLDGLISAICLAPISLPLSATMPIPCMCYGATKCFYDKVQVNIYKDAFDLAVTDHLYQWIELAKLLSISTASQQQAEPVILSAKQWRRLEKRLTSFVTHESLPQVSQQDIKKYLQIAINLFVSRNSQNLCIIKHYAD